MQIFLSQLFKNKIKRTVRKLKTVIYLHLNDLMKWTEIIYKWNGN